MAIRRVFSSSYDKHFRRVKASAVWHASGLSVFTSKIFHWTIEHAGGSHPNPHVRLLLALEHLHFKAQPPAQLQT